VRHDQLLESINPVLQSHEVGDGLITFVGVIDGFETNVLFVFKSSVKLKVGSVEGELGHQVEYVFADYGGVTTDAVAGACATSQAVDPIFMCHGLSQGGNVAFLKDSVNSDEGLEGANFIVEERLAAAMLHLSEC
jgi:hypothetical protein